MTQADGKAVREQFGGEGPTAQMQWLAARGQRRGFRRLRVHGGLAVVWSHPVVNECWPLS